MLVALLILGIMSALGYGTYREARISAERTEEALKRSREIEFGMRVLVMDFAQMVPRPVRDPLGQTRVPALRGFSGNGTSASTTGVAVFRSGSSSGSGFHLRACTSTPIRASIRSFGDSSSTTTIALAELTRAGWSNTAGQQRSTLQRVSYALVDDVLKRSYTTALDTVQGTKPQIQDLFGGVKTHPVALPRRQSDLAEPMAAADPAARPRRCGPGRWPWKSPSSSRIGGAYAG